MKNKEKSIIIFATFSVVFLSLLFVVGFRYIEILKVDGYLYIVLNLFFFGVYLFLVYNSINFFLAPMFKTNKILDLLLKDTLHELNIPLSVINANLQLLRLEEKSSSKIKRLDRISLACLDLTRLYKDVDYYIKKEVLEDLKEEFELSEVLNSVIEKFASLNLHVKINYDGKSLKLKVDKHGFIKILTNLLDNAIKYNKNNNPINIELNDTKLCIIDNGIGMDESEVFNVFNRYYQEDNKNMGYGIGLSIVKAYCDEEKIFIKIDSKKEKGTKISLDLSKVIAE
ncbi:sensor histidine kinase [Sulfurospirillum sp. 1307]